MIHKIILNGREIPYDLQRKNVKNINLRISQDKGIIVSANKRVSVRVIEDFMRLNSEFILNALDKFAERSKRLPQPLSYVDDEKIALLGTKRRLKVFEDSKNHIEESDDFIYLFVRDTDDVLLKKRVIEEWKRKYCTDLVTKRCREIYSVFERLGISFPEIKFRKMVSCWGNCKPTRNILTFNTSLIEAPIECIDYVVMHEFTHFLHPNHSRQFYNQLSEFMPDWRERKILLNSWQMN